MEWNVVGVDVSKNSLELSAQEWKAKVDNNPKGLATLKRKLKAVKKPLVVFEATGSYHQLLQEKLGEAHVAHKLVNPKRVRDFAKSRGILAKTDKLDAEVIRYYGEQTPLEPDAPLSKGMQRLRALVRRRYDLVKLSVQEKNRAASTSDPLLKRTIIAVLDTLKQQRLLVEKEMTRLIADDKELSRKHEILCSVKGISHVGASTCLALLPELGSVSRTQIAALVGVAPYNDESGTLRGKRAIWGGRAEVREALYMCALVASRYNGAVRDTYYRLRENGKQHKKAMIAAIRKLLHIINAMIRDNQTIKT